MMKKILLALSLALSCTMSSAEELEVMVGKVVDLEATYMPGTIAFWLDGGSASCPAGKMLFWRKADQVNNRIVYATLQQAIGTGQRIMFYVAKGDTGCNGLYIHLLKD